MQVPQFSGREALVRELIARSTDPTPAAVPKVLARQTVFGVQS
jgi:hypothetical protein